MATMNDGNNNTIEKLMKQQLDLGGASTNDGDDKQGGGVKKKKNEEQPKTTTTTTMMMGDDDIMTTTTKKKKRSTIVRFHDNIVTSVKEIQSWNDDDDDDDEATTKNDLFYNEKDFAKFQQDENQRYQQELLQMALFTMADKLQEFASKGATQEEIEMMILDEMNKNKNIVPPKKNAFLKIPNTEKSASASNKNSKKKEPTMTTL